MAASNPADDADTDDWDPDDHLLIPIEQVDEILDAVRERAGDAPDVAFEAGMVEGAEHYDRLLREYAE